MSEKTHAEIIAEMRNYSNKCNDGYHTDYGVVREDMCNYADRLEAAHKREMDDLRQLRDVRRKRAEKNLERCTELNAEVAAKDEVVKRLNDAIAEEQRRKMATTEKSSAVGNVAKLREALEKILWCFKWMFDNTDDKSVQSHLGEPIALAKAALAAPPRNCDMPLVVDGPADNNADKAWLVFKRHNPDAYFDVSGLLRCIDWLFALATEKEGDAK